MAKIKQRGKAGAAKAYITRSAAVKKLQCSLADFRRLCILKGIFPREPRHRKRANKGSSAPTSFYYAKDIAYLAHEPVLKKLREHKAFAKKLARALGRGEWSSAKSLEDSRPVYTLDHVVKERYPTFIDALRDIDDALCLVSLFASLPMNGQLPKPLIDNCARLSAEWQLYVMHSRSLSKSFLSIKGVYFQAEVMAQTITWLAPYQFTQNIPVDVDVRVLLTFLEFYQTLLGFVFFKLYTDAGLAYPPPMDENKDAAGAGVGAFSLEETTQQRISPIMKDIDTSKSKVSAKDVRDAIRSVATTAGALEDTSESTTAIETANQSAEDDVFVLQPSKSTGRDSALVTLKDIAALPQSSSSRLFAPFVFFLSREVSRPLFEFMIRSYGGRVGWPASSGSGAPVQEVDDSITHVITDRPLLESNRANQRRDRKYVQPQWIVDCINAGKVLPEDAYAQGKTLPPHLSPFGEEKGAYLPAQLADDDAMEASDEEISCKDGEDEGDISEEKVIIVDGNIANDPEKLRQAELEAEVRGVSYDAFAKEVGKAARQSQKANDMPTMQTEAGEKDMNKMLMSRKQRKLYEKMKYSQNKKTAEREHIEAKRQQLKKENRRKSAST